jgi:hypothetical protein
MSDGPPEKRQGFERWVASLKIASPLRPPSSPPAAAEGADGSTLTLDEQATLINRLPKEMIYKLRERDSQRAGMPKSDDSTAVFTPPPELLARAKRFQAPPKPERSSPTSSSSPTTSSSPISSRAPISPKMMPPRPQNSDNSPTARPPPIAAAAQANLSAAEAAAFASLESEEEPTTYYKPDIAEAPSSAPPSSPMLGVPMPLQGEITRPGDIQWIDGLASGPPTGPAPPLSTHPVVGSVAPAERRLRWVAVLVALVLLAGIFLLSRMQ